MILENTVLIGPFTLVLSNPLKTCYKLWFPVKAAPLVKDFNVSIVSLVISQHYTGLKISKPNKKGLLKLFKASVKSQVTGPPHRSHTCQNEAGPTASVCWAKA